MSVWELHGSRELCLRSALAHVDYRVHMQEPLETTEHHGPASYLF